jgi:glycerophosphoryl diester phosphodiesterase
VVNRLRAMTKLRNIVAACLAGAFQIQAAETVWNFDDASNRLAAESGPATLSYFDPDGTGWGPDLSLFGTAAGFGLPAVAGGDAAVMCFPATTSRQGYRVTHLAVPNGVYSNAGRVSNYTLIMDVLFAAGSDGYWRSLYQTDPGNSGDGELYVENAPSGGIGVNSRYHGSIRPNTWHRIALVVRAAPGEGQLHKFIDGQFVGGQGTTGSAIDIRWALQSAFLLFTDGALNTAGGYVSSVSFVDRNMRMEEVRAIGGPHAAGANVPGAPPPPLPHRGTRRVEIIAHRGNSCCAPENTLPAITQAFDRGASYIEIDIRLSADGVAVLMHDSTVDRTTDGSGAANGKTVAQLKQLDAGSWFSADYTGTLVPTLAEAMEAAKGRGALYLDIKVGGMASAISNAIAQTGFNPDDLWLWPYNNTSDAAALRNAIPNGKIIWEPSLSSWRNDPNYFQNLRNIGVYGFDQGSGTGNVDPFFVAAAKAAGFYFATYTILDPDSMLRAIQNGVDAMETDFPDILRQMIPAPQDKATMPTPARGATNVSSNVVLSWLIASNAFSRDVYFGAVAPPPFAGTQTSDLFAATNLEAGVTYFWRVDENTPTGAVEGEVWSFTVAASNGPAGALYQWDFDQGTLAPSIGNGVLAYADGISQTSTAFGTTDGTTVPHISGEPAAYMRVPAFTGMGNGYDVSFTDSGPNGGGIYINQFTLVFDVLLPGDVGWMPFFNTNPENANDADFYVNPNGSVGIAELGYSSPGLIGSNTWYRVAFVADLGAGLVHYYINGTLARTRTGGSLMDGRFSLYSNADPGPDLLLFNEGDGSGVYTHEVLLNSFFFTDRSMAAGEIGALGGPRASGIRERTAPVLSGSRSGGNIHLAWPGATDIRLQRSATLSPPDWQDVTNTAGTSSYSESISGVEAYFRLVREP